MTRVIVQHAVLFTLILVLLTLVTVSAVGICNTGWELANSHTNEQCFGSSTCGVTSLCECRNPRMTGVFCELEYELHSHTPQNTVPTLIERLDYNDANHILKVPLGENFEVYSRQIDIARLPIAYISMQQHIVLNNGVMKLFLDDLFVMNISSPIDVLPQQKFTIPLPSITTLQKHIALSLVPGNEYNLYLKTSYEFSIQNGDIFVEESIFNNNMPGPYEASIRLLTLHVVDERTEYQSSISSQVCGSIDVSSPLSHTHCQMCGCAGHRWGPNWEYSYTQLPPTVAYPYGELNLDGLMYDVVHPIDGLPVLFIPSSLSAIDSVLLPSGFSLVFIPADSPLDTKGRVIDPHIEKFIVHTTGIDQGSICRGNRGEEGNGDGQSRGTNINLNIPLKYRAAYYSSEPSDLVDVHGHVHTNIPSVYANRDDNEYFIWLQCADVRKEMQYLVQNNIQYRQVIRGVTIAQRNHKVMGYIGGVEAINHDSYGVTTNSSLAFSALQCLDGFTGPYCNIRYKVFPYIHKPSDDEQYNWEKQQQEEEQQLDLQQTWVVFESTTHLIEMIQQQQQDFDTITIYTTSLNGSKNKKIVTWSPLEQPMLRFRVPFSALSRDYSRDNGALGGLILDLEFTHSITHQIVTLSQVKYQDLQINIVSQVRYMREVLTHWPITGVHHENGFIPCNMQYTSRLVGPSVSSFNGNTNNNNNVDEEQDQQEQQDPLELWLKYPTAQLIEYYATFGGGDAAQQQQQQRLCTCNVATATGFYCQYKAEINVESRYHGEPLPLTLTTTGDAYRFQQNSAGFEKYACTLRYTLTIDVPNSDSGNGNVNTIDISNIRTPQSCVMPYTNDVEVVYNTQIIPYIDFTQNEMQNFINQYYNGNLLSFFDDFLHPNSKLYTSIISISLCFGPYCDVLQVQVRPTWPENSVNQVIPNSSRFIGWTLNQLNPQIICQPGCTANVDNSDPCGACGSIDLTTVQDSYISKFGIFSQQQQQQNNQQDGYILTPSMYSTLINPYWPDLQSFSRCTWPQGEQPSQQQQPTDCVVSSSGSIELDFSLNTNNAYYLKPLSTTTPLQAAQPLPIRLAPRANPDGTVDVQIEALMFTTEAKHPYMPIICAHGRQWLPVSQKCDCSPTATHHYVGDNCQYRFPVLDVTTIPSNQLNDVDKRYLPRFWSTQQQTLFFWADYDSRFEPMMHDSQKVQVDTAEQIPGAQHHMLIPQSISVYTNADLSQPVRTIQFVENFQQEPRAMLIIQPDVIYPSSLNTNDDGNEQYNIKMVFILDFSQSNLFINANVDDKIELSFAAFRKHDPEPYTLNLHYNIQMLKQTFSSTFGCYYNQYTILPPPSTQQQTSFDGFDFIQQFIDTIQNVGEIPYTYPFDGETQVEINNAKLQSEFTFNSFFIQQQQEQQQQHNSICHCPPGRTGERCGMGIDLILTSELTSFWTPPDNNVFQIVLNGIYPYQFIHHPVFLKSTSATTPGDYIWAQKRLYKGKKCNIYLRLKDGSSNNIDNVDQQPQHIWKIGDCINFRLDSTTPLSYLTIPSLSQLGLATTITDPQQQEQYISQLPFEIVVDYLDLGMLTLFTNVQITTTLVNADLNQYLLLPFEQYYYPSWVATGWIPTSNPDYLYYREPTTLPHNNVIPADMSTLTTIYRELAKISVYPTESVNFYLLNARLATVLSVYPGTLVTYTTIAHNGEIYTVNADNFDLQIITSHVPADEKNIVLITFTDQNSAQNQYYLPINVLTPKSYINKLIDMHNDYLQKNMITSVEPIPYCTRQTSFSTADIAKFLSDPYGRQTFCQCQIPGTSGQHCELQLILNTPQQQPVTAPSIGYVYRRKLTFDMTYHPTVDEAERWLFFNRSDLYLPAEVVINYQNQRIGRTNTFEWFGGYTGKVHIYLTRALPVATPATGPITIEIIVTTPDLVKINIPLQIYVLSDDLPSTTACQDTQNAADDWGPGCYVSSCQSVTFSQDTSPSPTCLCSDFANPTTRCTTCLPGNLRDAADGKCKPFVFTWDMAEPLVLEHNNKDNLIRHYWSLNGAITSTSNQDNYNIVLNTPKFTSNATYTLKTLFMNTTQIDYTLNNYQQYAIHTKWSTSMKSSGGMVYKSDYPLIQLKFIQQTTNPTTNENSFFITPPFFLGESFKFPIGIEDGVIYNVEVFVDGVSLVDSFNSLGSLTTQTNTCEMLTLLDICHSVNPMSNIARCDYNAAVDLLQQVKERNSNNVNNNNNNNLPILLHNDICQCSSNIVGFNTQTSIPYGSTCRATSSSSEVIPTFDTNIYKISTGTILTWGSVLFPTTAITTQYSTTGIPDVYLVDANNVIIGTLQVINGNYVLPERWELNNDNNNNNNNNVQQQWILPLSIIAMYSPTPTTASYYGNILPTTLHLLSPHTRRVLDTFQLSHPHIIQPQYHEANSTLSFKVHPPTLMFDTNPMLEEEISVWRVYLIPAEILENQPKTATYTPGDGFEQTANRIINTQPLYSDDFLPNTTYVPLELILPDLNMSIIAGDNNNYNNNGVFEIPHAAMMSWYYKQKSTTSQTNNNNNNNFISPPLFNVIAYILPNIGYTGQLHLVMRPIVLPSSPSASIIQTLLTSKKHFGFAILNQLPSSACHTSSIGQQCSPLNPIPIRHTEASCPFTCPYPFEQDLKCQCICTTQYCKQHTRIGQLYIQFGDSKLTQNDEILKETFFGTFLKSYLSRVLRLNNYPTYALAKASLMNSRGGINIDLTAEELIVVNDLNITQIPYVIGTEKIWIQPITSKSMDYRVLQYFIVITPYPDVYNIMNNDATHIENNTSTNNNNNVFVLEQVNQRFVQLFTLLAKPMLYPTSNTGTNLSRIAMPRGAGVSHITFPIMNTPSTNTTTPSPIPPTSFFVPPITSTTVGTQRFQVQCQPQRQLNDGIVYTNSVCPTGAQKSSPYWSECLLTHTFFMQLSPLCIDMYGTTLKYNTFDNNGVDYITINDLVNKSFFEILSLTNAICDESYSNFPQSLTTTCPAVLPPAPPADMFLIDTNPISGIPSTLSLSRQYRVTWALTSVNSTYIDTSTVSVYLLNTAATRSSNSNTNNNTYPILLTTTPAKQGYTMITIPTTIQITNYTANINTNVKIQLIVNQNTKANRISTQVYQLIDDVDRCAIYKTYCDTAQHATTCERYSGNCQCLIGYKPGVYSQQTVAPGQVYDSSFYGLHCVPDCGTNDCNGRGVCVYNANTRASTCSCRESYDGKHCEITKNCKEESARLCYQRGSVGFVENSINGGAGGGKCQDTCSLCDNSFDVTTNCATCLLTSSNTTTIDTIPNANDGVDVDGDSIINGGDDIDDSESMSFYFQQQQEQQDEATQQQQQQQTRNIITPCYLPGTNITLTNMKCNTCICKIGWGGVLCNIRSMYGVIQFSGIPQVHSSQLDGNDDSYRYINVGGEGGDDDKNSITIQSQQQVTTKMSNNNNNYDVKKTITSGGLSHVGNIMSAYQLERWMQQQKEKQNKQQQYQLGNNNNNTTIQSLSSLSLTSKTTESNNTPTPLSQEAIYSLERDLALSLEIDPSLVRLVLLQQNNKFVELSSLMNKNNGGDTTINHANAYFDISGYTDNGNNNNNNIDILADAPITTVFSISAASSTTTTTTTNTGSSAQQQQMSDLYQQWLNLQKHLNNQNSTSSSTTIPIQDSPAVQEVGKPTNSKPAFDPNCKQQQQTSNNNNLQYYCPDGDDPFIDFYNQQQTDNHNNNKSKKNVITSAIIVIIIVVVVIIGFITTAVAVAWCKKQKKCCFNPKTTKNDTITIIDENNVHLELTTISSATAGTSNNNDDVMSRTYGKSRTASIATANSTIQQQHQQQSRTSRAVSHAKSRSTTNINDGEDCDTTAIGLIQVIEDEEAKTLPTGWKKMKNLQTDEIYYMNELTLKSQKHHPLTKTILEEGGMTVNQFGW